MFRLASLSAVITRRRCIAALSLCLIPVAVLADTASRSAPNTGGCYCHCEAGKTKCVMMCDTRKNSSHWWATTCARPRAIVPKENRGAGPHFSRNDRAERASLQ